MDRSKTHGLVFSQRLLLGLIDAGLNREAAYDLVQPLAMQAWRGEGQYDGLDGELLHGYISRKPKAARVLTNEPCAAARWLALAARAAGVAEVPLLVAFAVARLVAPVVESYGARRIPTVVPNRIPSGMQDDGVSMLGRLLGGRSDQPSIADP